MQVRRGQEHCSEALFQLRCAISCDFAGDNGRGSLSTCCGCFACSLSPVGKPALLAHEGCMGVLRHHARATEDAKMGARCRGALAAMEERRPAGSAAGAGTAAAHKGHLMLS